jgi:hypothetical protein
MTTNETNQIVRWLVIIVLGAATAGMAAVSLRANYLFGYGFGQTPEKAHVFGWANVAADLWKVSGLIIITSLWRARQKCFALTLMPIWALCFVWGLAGAVGVYAQDRTALIGGRDAVGRVVKWMAERTEPTGDTSAITIDELHADYEVWCFAKGLRATARDDYTSEFDRVREVPQLAGKIRKFGNRYYGIRLVNSNIARLPTRKGST